MASAIPPEQEELQYKAGIDMLFSYQRHYFDWIKNAGPRSRSCLYHRTGAGKSLTALGGLFVLGVEECLVICPPATHEQWRLLGQSLGIDIQVMSHAKFRMPKTKLSRKTPLIVDEMHLLGGHRGKGWVKLDRLAELIDAPLILASATPNYNDAERVYCIQHVLDPDSCRGGYLQFLYTQCVTKQNPFSMTPDVESFRYHDSAADYLAALRNVFYVPDTTSTHIQPLEYSGQVSVGLTRYHYDRSRHRVCASTMELKHAIRRHQLIVGSSLRATALDALLSATGSSPALVFAQSSIIASVAEASLRELAGRTAGLITGKTSPKSREKIFQDFKSGKIQYLVGTATLATGVDGLDKVCDTLVIVDDTEDDSLRRQLIGRIVHRGRDPISATPISNRAKKKVFRMEMT